MRQAIMVLMAFEGLLVGAAGWWVFTIILSRTVLPTMPEDEFNSEYTKAICVTFLLFPAAALGGAWAGVRVVRWFWPEQTAPHDLGSP
jgi:hypothetical protein